VMGFAVVVASALTGLAVVRMYFALFCGRPAPEAQSIRGFALTRREAWTFVALVITLLGFGLAPRLLVDSRFAASEDILRRRKQTLEARTFSSPVAGPASSYGNSRPAAIRQ
jgi:NADH-quinone oxidoreductase subunit M